jgi:hypothetical protein
LKNALHSSDDKYESREEAFKKHENELVAKISDLVKKKNEQEQILKSHNANSVTEINQWKSKVEKMKLEVTEYEKKLVAC